MAKFDTLFPTKRLKTHTFGVTHTYTAHIRVITSVTIIDLMTRAKIACLACQLHYQAWFTFEISRTLEPSLAQATSLQQPLFLITEVFQPLYNGHLSNNLPITATFLRPRCFKARVLVRSLSCKSNSFPHERLCTRDHFETELGNGLLGFDYLCLPFKIRADYRKQIQSLRKHIPVRNSILFYIIKPSLLQINSPIQTLLSL